MSVRDITDDSVLAAIQSGHDDADKLAEHFGVLPASHTLRITLFVLGEQGRLWRFSVPGSQTPRFEVA